MRKPVTSTVKYAVDHRRDLQLKIITPGGLDARVERVADGGFEDARRPGHSFGGLLDLALQSARGGGATGQVSRAGAVRGNAVVLGMKFDFVGNFRRGQASGTLVGPNGCPGRWTATKS
jgi:hypothetical protein